MIELSESNKIDLVIFDMDGVLTDSEPAITYASMESLSEVGVTAQYADFKPFTGTGDDNFIRGVAEKYGYTYSDALKERAYEIYLEKLDRVKVFPESLRVLNALTEQFNLPCSVASAADFIKVEANLKCIGVTLSYFKAVVTGSDVINKKPDPEIFLKAAQKSGAVPGRCIVIEDALSGIQAAKSAGMTAVGVTTSFEKSRLTAAGADYVIDNLEKLLPLIEILNPPRNSVDNSPTL